MVQYNAMMTEIADLKAALRNTYGEASQALQDKRHTLTHEGRECSSIVITLPTRELLRCIEPQLIGRHVNS